MAFEGDAGTDDGAEDGGDDGDDDIVNDAGGGEVGGVGLNIPGIGGGAGPFLTAFLFGTPSTS